MLSPGKELRQHERRAVLEALKSAQVICGTTTTVSLEGPLKHLPEGIYTALSACCADAQTPLQITLTWRWWMRLARLWKWLAGLLSAWLQGACLQMKPICAIAALTHVGRAVLAGDHLQLPPTITSKAAAQGGLNYTLLERVVDAYGDSVVKMLDTQVWRRLACCPACRF
jgi:ATP-dependent RNA/DNA helicase IGHMBP2